MNLVLGEINGTLNIGFNKPKERKATDCATCKYGWNPPGDVTRIVKDDGSVLIQYGNNTICMDESKDKNIDFSDGEMCCSKYEPKPMIGEDHDDR